MEVSKDIRWSRRLEEYFADLGERAYCYSWLHKKCEDIFSYRRTCVDLPVIVLSTLAGTLSIGNSSLFGEENEQLASKFIGGLSLIVGIMNTVTTYFGFAKRSENHRLCSIQYSKLYRFIHIELSLPQAERMSCADMLKVCRDQFERLQEIAPLVPDSVISDFKKRFASYTDISKPSETNGLQSIEIYDEAAGRKLPRSLTSPKLSIKTPGPGSLDSLRSPTPPGPQGLASPSEYTHNREEDSHSPVHITPVQTP